jgi:hypothetical protein
MPTYALLGADLYLPPTLCTWVGGGGPESTGKNIKPELPVPSALSGAQLKIFQLYFFMLFLVTNKSFEKCKNLNKQNNIKYVLYNRREVPIAFSNTIA